MLHNSNCLKPLPDNLYFPPREGDYVYFERPSFQPGGFSYLNAGWAADAAMLAYARFGRTRMTDAGFRQILSGAGFTTIETIGDCFVDHASTARGFFAATDAFAILAFRGTEKDNPNDIRTDAEAALVPEEPLGGRSAGLVHIGFQNYLRSVRPRVASLVANYRATHPRQEICFTGHSLGAVLASLAFHQLQDGHSSLYTFGCPRVGDARFCADLSAAGATQVCYRIVDNEDLVAHVPPEVGYTHPNFTIVWIDAAGGVQENPANLPADCGDFADLVGGFFGHTLLTGDVSRPLADHSPVRYCHYIWVKATGIILFSSPQSATR